MHEAERARALERRVLRLFDRGDAAEPRIEQPHPREFALRCALQVARAPDDPAVLVILMIPFVASTLTPGTDSAAPRRRNGCTVPPRLKDWTHDRADIALRERLPPRVCARRRLHDPPRDRRPGDNAEAVLAAARECDADAVAVAVFPELCLTGYSLEDLVMQDPVLDAVEAAIERLVEASAELLPDARRRRAAASPQPPLQLRRRHPPRRGARRRAQVVPAHLP